RDLRPSPTRRSSDLLAHLQTLRYSLDVPEPSHVLERDPIETFLFETQAGHCEYFATALAVLLREVGVPARIVNGYYGAHYNELRSEEHTSELQSREN